MRQKIVFGVLLTVLGILAFLVASSWVIDRGYAKVAAAAVGLFAFPIAPCAWHFWRERKRGEVKSALTRADRFWLRFAVVALVVIGPMVAADRLDVVRAVFRHGLWFVPSSPPAHAHDYSRASKLLARVPASAEMVIVFEQDNGAGVIAWGANHLLGAFDRAIDDDKEPLAQRIDKLNAMRDALLPFEKVAIVPTTDDTIVVASESWRSAVEPPGKGASAELRRELARAPEGAVLETAYVPRHPYRGITRSAGWITHSATELAVENRLEMESAAAATALVAEMPKLPDQLGTLSAKCREVVAKLVAKVDAQASGTIVTLHTTLEPMALFGLAACAAD